MNTNSNWKNKTIRFLSAQTISLFGSSLVQYAIIWYITLTTSSGVMMTLSTLCGYLPQIMISLFAGAWLDRYDRKKLMMLADGIIAAATLLIALLFLSGHQNIWLLFAVLVVRSAGTGVQTPAVNAFLPQLVPQEKLMRINGINSTLTAATTFLSPAVSGVMLSVSSIEATFFVDVLTALIGIGIMFTIRAPKVEHTGEALSAVADIRQGIAYLKENRFLRLQIIYLAVVGVLISPAAFLTPLLIERAYGGQVWMLSLAQMLFSLGAVLGGIFISIWGGFENRRKTILFATVFYGAMMVGMGASSVYWVFLVFNFLVGISMPCYNAPLNVALQENTRPEMMGRVFSMVQIANACALPLGTVLFGPLADVVTVGTVLWICGVAVAGFALIYGGLLFFDKRAK